MRMTRRFFWLLFLLTILTSLCGCRMKSNYNYMHSKSDISKISIVIIGFDDDSCLQVNEVIAVVDNREAFLIDFEKIPCYVWLSDPIGISLEQEGTMVLKFDYSNGDYEFITYKGMAEYSVEKGIRNYTGYRIFDEDSFEKLLITYSGTIQK